MLHPLIRFEDDCEDCNKCFHTETDLKQHFHVKIPFFMTAQSSMMSHVIIAINDFSLKAV